MRTFKHDFGNDVTCEIQVADSPPVAIEGTLGSGHILNVEWTGNRTDQMISQYIAWINSVNKQLADEWGVKMMHVFMPPKRRAEVWVYEPGRAPKRMRFTA